MTIERLFIHRFCLCNFTVQFRQSNSTWQQHGIFVCLLLSFPHLQMHKTGSSDLPASQRKVKMLAQHAQHVKSLLPVPSWKFRRLVCRDKTSDVLSFPWDVCMKSPSTMSTVGRKGCVGVSEVTSPSSVCYICKVPGYEAWVSLTAAYSSCFAYSAEVVHNGSVYTDKDWLVQQLTAKTTNSLSRLTPSLPSPTTLLHTYNKANTWTPSLLHTCFPPILLKKTHTHTYTKLCHKESITFLSWVADYVHAAVLLWHLEYIHLNISAKASLCAFSHSPISSRKFTYTP